MRSWNFRKPLGYQTVGLYQLTLTGLISIVVVSGWQESYSSAQPDAGSTTRMVAVVQFDAVPEAVDKNCQRMEQLVRQAVGKGAEWIVFHEQATCDCTANLDRFAEAVPDGPSTLHMMRLAKELKCHISFGLAEKERDRFYITQVFVGPIGFIYRYRKTWLYRDAADAGFRDEHARFDPGTGPELFEFDGVKATCYICADGTSKRCIERASLLRPQVVFYPVNMCEPDPTWFRKFAGDHARQIGAPILMPNRVGASWVHQVGKGGSIIVSADGETVAAANMDGKEEVVLHQLLIHAR